MKKTTLISLLSLFFVLSFTYNSYGQCTHSICLYDTYGDGWNGGSISVSVGGSTVVSSATISSGAGPNCYNFNVSTGQAITITYSAGSWSSENYYRIYNNSGGSGSLLYGSPSGSTPPSYNTVTANCSGGTVTTCTHSICLNDTYGDGWSGGSVSVSVGGSTVVNSVTLSSGAGPSCYNFNVSTGQAITITYSAGSWSSENYYQIYNNSGGSGSLLYGSSSGSTPPSYNTVTANCSGGGVTPPANTCLGAVPFCTSDAYTFPASTNVPSMGQVGCLYTTPNPAWYWMEIGNPGNIDIYMSSGGDVDFIAWGPFASLQAACASNLMSNSGVDCSYSAAATETANLTNTHTGEVYVLLITNYANITTNISFSQTSGAGSTNCGIIAPPITNNGPLCVGATLQLSVTSPTAGATYAWTGPNGFTSSSMNPTISNVTTAHAGTYSLVITVGTETSPAVTTTVVISPNVTPTFAAGGTYCAGTSISALPTTSTNSITGTWSPAINNTTTTTYTFTPTSGQCATTTTNTINITPMTNPTFTQVGPYCTGTTINPLPTTSLNGITGSWSPALSTTNTGTYTFTPTAGQCANTTTMTIVITQTITPTFVAVGPYCSGVNIPALPTTSTNSVTGTWSPAINNTATTNYTFTPASGQCTLSTTMQITVNENVTPTFSPVGPYCHGTYIPALATTSINGISGTWSPAINNTATTNYTFTPNPGQCAYSINMTIEIELLESELLSTTNQFCDASGTAQVSGINGTPNYTYLWPSNAMGISNGSANNLTAGDYTVTIIDAHGCQGTQNLSIGFTDNMSASASLINHPVCYGEVNGAIAVSIINGTGPYNIEIDSTNLTVNTANYNLNNLQAGTYNLYITDINGCQASANYTLIQPTELIANANYIQIACAGESATVTVTATGGTPSYTGIGTFEVSSGIHSYTVSDFKGCSSVAQVTVPVAPAPLSLVAVVENVTCYNSNDGSISINASGGTSPLVYNWNNEMSTANLSGLAGGNYTLTILDNNQCSITRSYTITEPEKINLSYFTKNLLCYDARDGGVQMEASGGVTPYTFGIYNIRYQAVGAIHNNLAADNYTISVKDSHNCQVTKNISISSPAELIVSVNTLNPSCIGNNDGHIEIITSGGTEPYLYFFEQMIFPNSFISKLTKGTYNIEVEDANSCTKQINLISLTDNPIDCIVIPNAFTPNGDGTNDTWIVEGLEKFPQVILQVFNRWGQPMFNSTRENTIWDGKLNDKLVPTGTYVYFL
ncbi:MAG: gliding motility-associated C-terminal domain-containing protein, partial [Bacteroidales bacterium]|nr:gliding motility-associated C-terminal domain-containing protein [Bacteroidales bacterium]